VDTLLSGLISTDFGTWSYRVWFMIYYYYYYYFKHCPARCWWVQNLSVEANYVDLFRRQDIDLHAVLHNHLVFGFCVSNNLIRCASLFWISHAVFSLSLCY